jgi:hypothetical protein
MSNARKEGAQEGTRDVPTARNSEERVAQVLEASRQAVKDLVRRELETESVNSDLLNLRLRA